MDHYDLPMGDHPYGGGRGGGKGKIALEGEGVGGEDTPPGLGGFMIDRQLREVILRQVRLSPALLSVMLMMEMGVELEQALTRASSAHRVEKIDLTVMWTELVLRNSQSIISRPWKQKGV
jgi:hypothetical protein